MPVIRTIAACLLPLLALASPGGSAQAAASGWDRQVHGAARLISAVEATGTGARIDVGLQLRLSPGWHTYWRTPGDAGVAPTIDWKGSENLAGVAIAWPAPQRLPPLGGLETVGFVDGVVLPITVTLAHPGAALHLHAEVDYASCKEVCIPYHASLDLTLPPGLAQPGPEAKLIATARARVPGDFAAAGLTLRGAVVAPAKDGAVLSVRLASTGAPLRSPDLLVEGTPDLSPGRPESALAEGGRAATLRVPIRGTTSASLAGKPLHLTVVDGARAAEAETVPVAGTLPPLPGGMARTSMIGIALLGGVILNLMPCVLPVLSLKLLALASYGGAARRTARLGLLASAAGVLASFAVIALALIALKAAGAAIGWGIQFQYPWFLAAMALATTLFAANLWNWLPIALPSGLAGALGAVRGGGWFAEAFLLGAFATVLAASCSAPFVGTALGFALARGPADIALIFAALGLGMAAPFLTVAAAPGLVAWLPRPGPWMAWLRRGLGVALLGTAGWLLFVLAREAGADEALLAGALLAVLLAMLGWRHARPLRRRVATLAAVAAAVVAVLVPSLRGGAVPIAPPAQGGAVWQRFEEAALPRLVARGNIVFVDVTAAWCLTCKVNELTVMDRAPVADRLRAPGTVAMRADWTRPDPVIAAYLQRFGRYGVPLDVVYGPGAPDGIALPELLTREAVMDAFRRAGATMAKEASQ
ncbi:MAG: protein-disulfide reductase DsbD family protein [Rhodospirillales bacterium]|nr:protein-disulfide reductase DsbD family protein [Rhodospirillales bacterium]